MNNKGNMVKAIATDGGILVTAIDSTDVVKEMQNLHKLSLANTVALGRLITGASLMGTTNLRGPEESITIRIDGNGKAGVLIAVSDYSGNVKGYVQNPNAETTFKEDGKIDVVANVGNAGSFSVIKDLGLKEPQSGQVDLATGEIAEDITYYYAKSEQIPTACCLGVLVDKDSSVLAAGGFLAQVLPGGDDYDISALEKNIDGLKDISQLIYDGLSAEELAKSLLEGMEPQIIFSKQTEYKCNCSKEKVDRALISLGKSELLKIMQEDEATEVVCDFCNKTYVYNKEDLKALYDKARD